MATARSNPPSSTRPGGQRLTQWSWEILTETGNWTWPWRTAAPPNPSNVSVLLGNGDGTFQPAASYTAGEGPAALALGDFTQDGKLDLAVGDFYCGTPCGRVIVLLGNGDGTFQSPVSYSAGAQPISLAAEDLSGDGKMDLVEANNSSSNVSVLLGNGDGTFQAAVNYGVSSDAVSVALGDFNGDARPDLAVADLYSNEVSLLLGNGDGTFQPAVNYPVGSNPNSVAVGDFDGDGRLDLAVADSGSTTVSILLQAPTISLSKARAKFANQVVATTSAPQNVTLTNTGYETVTILAFASPGPT